MNQHRFVLRDLPLPARVTLAVFLLAVGLGYLSAMVQLHLQHSRSGSPLPTGDDVVRHFHGPPGDSKTMLERLIASDESLEFTGAGSMAAAFTKRSSGWTTAIRGGRGAKGEAAIRAEREGERLAMLTWVRAGCPKNAYDDDAFPLPDNWGPQPITDEFRTGDHVKIKSLVAERCVRCHSKSGEDEKACSFPLETLQQIQKYNSVDRVSLEKLAQSTHAHLLSFAVLFMLTGVLFALTSYSLSLRFVLAPLVLVAQVLDIACWWLARLDGRPGELFAQAIPVTGAVVGAGLACQIVLTLYHLFGAAGRVVLLLLFAGAGALGYVAKDQVVDPFLQKRAEEAPKN